MWISILSIISLIALILIVWFRTEAWVEYTRLLHLNYISKYKDYDEKKKEDITLTYHQYLRRYHNGFTTRLLTCPICFSVWIGIILSIFIPIISIPIIVLGGLILFLIVDKLLG